MSGLKEEWASIVKIRESEVTDERKKDQIKSRIFNNFYSTVKNSTKELPEISEFPVTPESKHVKNQLQKTLVAFERNKTPEPVKKFEFGLKNATPPPVKTSRDTVRASKNEEVWKIEDFPLKPMHDDVVPDKFEVLSLAEYNSIAKNLKTQKKDICIFSDLSPISRYMCNMTVEEEEMFIKESKKHEKLMSGFIHLLHQEPSSPQIEKLDWKSASKFCMGFIFKSEVCNIVQPNLVGHDVSINSNISKEISKSHIVYQEASQAKNTASQNQIISTMHMADDMSWLEAEMIHMMDMIKYQETGDNIEKKLQSLLEIVEKRMKSSKETSSNMQIRVLYQFLVEYKKAKESPKKSKPNENRAFAEKPGIKRKMPNEKLKTTTRHKKNESKFSVKSEKDSIEENDKIESPAFIKRQKPQRSDQLHKNLKAK